MSGQARPAREYCHGFDGPVALVPGRVAALLNQYILDELRPRVRGEDPELDQALIALRVIGEAWLQWRDSQKGNRGGNGEELLTESWMSTKQVSDWLGISIRGVRMAITQGRLPAERHGDRWMVRRQDAKDFRAAKAA